MPPVNEAEPNLSSSAGMRADQDGIGPAVNETPSFMSRAKLPLLVVAIALKIVLLFALSLHSVVVMDEFVQLGFAKYLGNGLFDTIWPVKSVGYAVFYKLAHVLGWDAVSVLQIGRVMTAVLGCCIVGMVYYSSRLLSASRVHALVVVLTLLSFSNFIERIFRTRAEPLAVCFAVASLLVVLRGKAASRSIFLAGILTGLAFITTQKSIYFNVALGAALVIDAACQRDLRLGINRGAFLVAGWFVPIAGYCIVFGGLAPLPVAHNLIFGPVTLVFEVPSLYENMGRFVLDTLAKNAILYAVCLAGMVIGLTQLMQLDSEQRIALVFSVLTCGFVYSHNQPWPYLFVMALPFMVLWVPTLLCAISKRFKNAQLLGLLVVAAVAISFLRNAQYLTHFGNAEQFSVVRAAEQLTGDGEQYFDGVGMLPNREEPSILWLDLPMVLRMQEQGQASELYLIFQRSPPETVIWSYRMDAVEPVIRDRLEASYVKVAPNIRVPGRMLESGLPTRFDAPKAGRYTLYSDRGLAVEGQLKIDGETVQLPASIAAGPATIELIGAPNRALLVQEGKYQGIFDASAPDYILFGNVYD